ncbi:hypothetical protein D3C79_433220 [compost metagenome]
MLECLRQQLRAAESTVDDNYLTTKGQERQDHPSCRTTSPHQQNTILLLDQLLAFKIGQ